MGREKPAARSMVIGQLHLLTEGVVGEDSLQLSLVIGECGLDHATVGAGLGPLGAPSGRSRPRTSLAS